MSCLPRRSREDLLIIRIHKKLKNNIHDVSIPSFPQFAEWLKEQGILCTYIILFVPKSIP